MYYIRTAEFVASGYIDSKSISGPSIDRVQRFTRQLLSALTTLEAANIIHCDLKLENILLSQAKEVTEIVGSMGEGSVSPPPGSTSSSRHLSSIKLIDFGSACFEGKRVLVTSKVAFIEVLK